MSSVIRSLMIKIGADLTDMQKGLNQASKTLKNVGKDFSSTGASLTKGLTVPILGAATALTGLAVKAGQNADELITMANKTGIATEQLQEMQYAARFIDVEVETMTGSMQKLTKSMDAARDGTGDQAAAFEQLGISITNQDGSLRNAKDVWAEAINALGGVSNEAEKDALSMRLFGKSAQELNPLIVAGTDELARLSEEAHNVGAVLSDDDVKAMGEFDDKMQSLQSVLEVAGSKIGLAFMPIIEQIAPKIQTVVIPAIQKFADWISDMINKFSELSPGMKKFVLTLVGVAVGIGPVFSVVGKLTTGIGGLMEAGSKALKAFKGAKTMLGGIKAAMTAFLGPSGLVLLAIVAIATAAFLIIKNWDKIKEFFTNLWDAVKNIFSAAWEWIKNMFLNYTPLGLVISHWETIKQFFINLWDSVKNIFSTAWDGIKTSLGNAANSIKNSVLNVFTSLKTGLKSIWDGIWGTIKNVINSIITGVEKMANGVVKGMNTVISALNRIQIKLPDWMGGKSFGLNIKSLNTISIPRLAEGAVIQPNKEFIAMLGDQKNGVSVETPLSTMVDAFETSLNKNGVGNITIYNPLSIDGKAVTNSTSKHQYNRNKVRSRSLGVVRA